MKTCHFMRVLVAQGLEQCSNKQREKRTLTQTSYQLKCYEISHRKRTMESENPMLRDICMRVVDDSIRQTDV